MKINSPLIAVIDDDESVRESLSDLLRQSGFDTDAFDSATTFLAQGGMSSYKCLVVDIAMPGMSGPSLQQHLKAAQISVPIIFITALRNDLLRARLIRDGAIDCLYKPFTDEDILQGLKSAIGMLPSS
jgi:FixJ family two-component response regulator